MLFVQIVCVYTHVGGVCAKWLLNCAILQGQAVGTVAHLVALRREAIGKYNVRDAWTVDQLQAAVTDLKHSKAQSSTADMHTQRDKATDAASASSSVKAPGLVQNETATAPMDSAQP